MFVQNRMMRISERKMFLFSGSTVRVCVCMNVRENAPEFRSR